MENIDPMGVHTGDSIVVSPVLTLTDREWQMIRTAALRIVDVLDIRGACNVQFALAPDGGEYYVIEVNPRASRSSAKRRGTRSPAWRQRLPSASTSRRWPTP